MVESIHSSELTKAYDKIVTLKESEAKLSDSCITELKVLSNQLIETESLLSAYWHFSPTIKVIAKNGILIKVNPAWTNALGYSKEELEGNTYIQLVHPDDRKLMYFVEGALNAGNKISDFIARFKHKTEDRYVAIEWAGTQYGGTIYASGIVRG